MFVLWSSPNPAPIKYRCLIKETNQITPAYLNIRTDVAILPPASGATKPRPCCTKSTWMLHWHMFSRFDPNMCKGGYVQLQKLLFELLWLPTYSTISCNDDVPDPQAPL